MASDKISFFTIQSRLKTLIENNKKMEGDEEYKSSSLNGIKLDFDASVFDWEKYAEALGKTKGEGTQVSTDEAFEGTDEEKAIFEIMNAAYEDEAVFKQTDTNSDGILSADELMTYFEGLNGFDDDSSTLSLKDFAKFFQDKKISFEDTVEASNEAVKKVQEEQAAAAAGAAGGGGGGGNGYVPAPKNTGDQQTIDPSKLPAKIDPATLDSANTMLYIDTSTNSTMAIASMDSSALSSTESGLFNVVTISPEDRIKLQQAAAAKETAAANVTTAKEALGDTTNENITAIETYQTAVENLATLTEQHNNTIALKEAAIIQQDNLNSQIETVSGNISTLEGQLSSIKASYPEDATEEEKAAAEREAEAQRNAIKEQIKSLENQKKGLEDQLKTVEGQIQQLESTEAQEQTSIEQQQQAVNDAKTAAEALKANMTKEEQAYLTSVTQLETASSEYNAVKNEIMTKSNQEAREAHNGLAAKQEAEKQAGENVPLYTTPTYSENDLKVRDVFGELHQAATSEEEIEFKTEEAKAAWETYNKLTPDEKKALIEYYGSEDKLLSIIAYTSCAPKIEGALTTEYLLNPSNYANINAIMADATEENRAEKIDQLIAAAKSSTDINEKLLLILITGMFTQNAEYEAAGLSIDKDSYSVDYLRQLGFTYTQIEDILGEDKTSEGNAQ